MQALVAAPPLAHIGRTAAIGWLLFAAIALSGCATGDPLAPEYQGPVAKIADSYVKDGSAADFFFLEKVNGATVNNALFATREANQGRGFSMDARDYTRSVPVQQSSFTITGRTEYAAPIQAFTHTVYQVSGDVSFTPEAGRTYYVKGVLSADGSAVWIEDDTGKVIDRKIEKKHAALGLLQK